MNVIEKIDPQLQIKIKDMVDGYNRLPYIYQSKTGYDTLIQNVIPKELLITMGVTITDIDMELKMKVSRIKHLESNLLWLLKVDEDMYNK